MWYTLFAVDCVRTMNARPLAGPSPLSTDHPKRSPGGAHKLTTPVVWLQALLGACATTPGKRSHQWQPASM